MIVLTIRCVRDELVRCYRVLEIEPGVSPEAVKKAYWQLAKVWHPDRFPNDPELQTRANTKLKEVNQAFEILSLYFAEAPATKNEASDWNPGQEAKKGHEIAIEVLTPRTIRQKQNVDYNSLISGPSFEGRVWDIVSARRLESEEAVGSWPHSAPFRKAVIDLFAKRFVRLLSASEVRDKRGELVSGTLSVKGREVILNTSTATNLTPLFLLAVIFVRDFLTMPGHKSRRHFAMRGLQGFGYKDDGLFCSSPYIEAENTLARKLAQLTFDDLAKTENREVFGSWLRSISCRLGSDSSLKNVLSYLSGCLIFDAPYNSRLDFAQSFRQ